jgi:hypothetical protein
MLTTARIFDVYDDPHGTVLCELFDGPEDIPASVKTAEALLPEELARLPDDAFALVVVEGGHKVRKYACVDAGHTELAAAYFAKTGEVLPLPLRREAAGRLLEACTTFDVPIPTPLEKLALGLGLLRAGLVAGPVAAGTKGAVKQNLAAVRALEGAGRVVTPAEVKTLAKVAEASGTDVMPAAPRAPAPRPASSAGGAFALRGRYPLTTRAQVKAASAYFEEHVRALVPEDRREFAQAVAARAEELQVPTAPLVAKYASETYASDEELAIARDLRLQRAREAMHPLVGALFDARRAVPPDVFARALGELDKEAGLTHLYDRELPDPYASTFAPTERAHTRPTVFVKGAARASFAEPARRDPKALERLSPRERAVLLRRGGA